MEQYKKPIIIGASVVGIAFAGLLLKNYIQQSSFKPMPVDQVIKLRKQIFKENYPHYKKIVSMALQMNAQFKQVNPEMVKGYLESPQSPIKLDSMLEEAIKKVCEKNNLSVQQLQANLEYYESKNEPQIIRLRELSERHLQASLSGTLPELNVKVPESLTKERILNIHTKLVRQRYLLQVDIFRKLKGKTQQDLVNSQELMQSLPNPDTLEEELLEEEHIDENGTDDPSTAIFTSAVLKYRGDPAFRQSLNSIENSFKNIFQRYQPKMQQNKITDQEINDLEDELIYFQFID